MNQRAFIRRIKKELKLCTLTKKKKQQKRFIVVLNKKRLIYVYL